MDAWKGLYMTGENVIVISFAEDTSAYEAFTNLKEVDAQEVLGVDDEIAEAAAGADHLGDDQHQERIGGCEPRAGKW